MRSCAAASKGIFTPATASAHGAIITNDAVATLNIGGCLALAIGDDKAFVCGVQISNADACVAAACANCVSAGSNAYEACKTQARRSSACSSFAVHPDCEALLFSEAGSKCATGSEFMLTALRLASFFCLSESDAGSD